MSRSLRTVGHDEQHNVFGLLRESGNDINLCFLAYSHSLEVGGNRYEWSWYPYDFDAGLVGCVEASVEPGRKRQKMTR